MRAISDHGRPILGFSNRKHPYDQHVRLGLEQGRVIGCLIEKQLTTPQQYPLSLNALVTACNQASNRDPVTCYDDRTVQRALAWLKDAGLVRFVYPSRGGSATRYRQVLDESLGLDQPALALVAVLLLRGPQTAGELRARTERMTSFDSVAAVDAELERLAAGAEPLVLQLPRRPGHKQERWVQLLTPDAPTGIGNLDDPDRAKTSADRAPDVEAQPGTLAHGVGADVGPAWPTGEREFSDRADSALNALADEVTALRHEVAALRNEVAVLEAAVEQRQMPG